MVDANWMGKNGRREAGGDYYTPVEARCPADGDIADGPTWVATYTSSTTREPLPMYRSNCV